MRDDARGIALLLSFHLGMASPAFAEVMDKMPSPISIWQWALVLAALAFAAGRLHPLLGLVLLLGPNVPLGVLSEIFDPGVGPAILAEAGRGYIYETFAANGLVLLSYGIGVARWRRFRRSASPSAPASTTPAEKFGK